MYAITTQLRFFHNNSPGAERFLGTPRFWEIFDLGTDGNLCRQGSDLFLDFCEKQPYSINIITITVIERYERKKTMSTLKYSRQRESIKVCLQGRKDHPTADMLYTDVRKEFPNISLGTVYRNLNLLTDIGEAIKISTPDGGDRFDGTVQPHNHFLCTKCGRFLDLELDMKSIEEMNRLANDCFDGMITSSSTLFYGECSDCIRKS